MSAEVENVADVPLPPSSIASESAVGNESHLSVTLKEHDSNTSIFSASNLGDSKKVDEADLAIAHQNNALIKEPDVEKGQAKSDKTIDLTSTVGKSMTESEFENSALERSRNPDDSMNVSADIEISRGATDSSENLSVNATSDNSAVGINEQQNAEVSSKTTTEALEHDETQQSEVSNQKVVPVGNADTEPQKENELDSQKNLDGTTHSAETSCTYFLDEQGKVYSVDQNGYWYLQDEYGNFVSYDLSLGHGHMFPLNDKGLPTLPINPNGEYAFPFDAHNMPVFPLDPITHLPIFPVDEYDNPVFPIGGYGRPIVPIDHNGAPVFPRDVNGHFIFPFGPDGKVVAPLNVFGISVLPLDEKGKPVIPRDASGKPLIHLASDGKGFIIFNTSLFYDLNWSESQVVSVAAADRKKSLHLFLFDTVCFGRFIILVNDLTLHRCRSIGCMEKEGKTPLTDEEYQYSLQWSNYYAGYNQYYANQATAPAIRSAAPVHTTDITDHVKHMKMLRKVRPEDIDLPPNDPPKSPPPTSVPAAKVAEEKPPTPPAKDMDDVAVKAKAKRLLEMQLKFARKKKAESTAAVSKIPNTTTINNDNSRSVAVEDTAKQSSVAKPAVSAEIAKEVRKDGEAGQKLIGDIALKHIQPEKPSSFVAPSPVPPPPVLTRELDKVKANTANTNEIVMSDIVKGKGHFQDEIAAKLKECVDSKNLFEQSEFARNDNELMETRDKRSRKRSYERDGERDERRSGRQFYNSRSKRSHYDNSDSERETLKSHRRSSRRNESDREARNLTALYYLFYFLRSPSADKSRNDRYRSSGSLSDEVSKRRSVSQSSVDEDEKTSRSRERRQDSKRSAKRSRRHKHSHRKHSKRPKDGSVNSSDNERQPASPYAARSEETYGPATVTESNNQPIDITEENFDDEDEKRRKKRSRKDKKKKSFVDSANKNDAADATSEVTRDERNELLGPSDLETTDSQVASPKSSLNGEEEVAKDEPMDVGDFAVEEERQGDRTSCTEENAKFEHKQADVDEGKELVQLQEIDGRFIRDTTTQPPIKFTSNIAMQESFVTINRQYQFKLSQAGTVEASTSFSERTCKEVEISDASDFVKTSENQNEKVRSNESSVASKEGDESTDDNSGFVSGVATEDTKEPRSGIDDVDATVPGTRTTNDLSGSGIFERHVISVMLQETGSSSDERVGAEDNTKEEYDDERTVLSKKADEQDDEELCRLRYEALRSKTKHLMEDLRAERRRLKRERVRAIMAIRRAKGSAVVNDTTVVKSAADLIQSPETSTTSGSDTSAVTGKFYESKIARKRHLKKSK
uniref:CNH domain-containing protein n=1 Tax=Syphacia muris TaxID=451379 RepID=A0A0N5AI59_9BILA